MQQHPFLYVLIWLAASGMINVVLRVHSAEAWVALGEKKPRLAAAIHVLRAIGLDPVKLINAIATIVRTKAALPPDAVVTVTKTTEVAVDGEPVASSSTVTIAKTELQIADDVLDRAEAAAGMTVDIAKPPGEAEAPAKQPEQGATEKP